jgi:hypothetical protein
MSPIKWEMQKYRDLRMENGLLTTDEAKQSGQSLFDMSVKITSLKYW